MITLETEGTDPDFGSKINDGEGIENGAAGTTAKRSIRKNRYIRERLDGSIDG